MISAHLTTPWINYLESLSFKFFLLWERERQKEGGDRGGWKEQRAGGGREGGRKTTPVAEELGRTDRKGDALGIMHNAWQSQRKQEDKLLWKWSVSVFPVGPHEAGGIGICYYFHFRGGHCLQDHINQARSGAGTCFGVTIYYSFFYIWP